MQDIHVMEQIIQVPPKPELFQWYEHEIPKKYKVLDIWLLQHNTVLWGFNISSTGKVEINNTNLKYWTEKDYPWDEFLDEGEKTTKSKCPKLSSEAKLKMMNVIFKNDKDSTWFYR